MQLRVNFEGEPTQPAVPQNKTKSPKDQKSSVTCCASFWKDPKLADRLNITGIITSVSDSLIDLIALRSTSFFEFFTNTIHYSITGLFYLVPTFIPFLPGLVNLFRQIPPKPDTADDEIRELEQLLEGDTEINEIFARHETLRQKMLEKIALHEKKKNHDSITFIINIIYLSLRALQSVPIFMRGTEATTQDTSDSVKSWLELISGLINIIYMCAMLVNFHQSQKTPVKQDKSQMKMQLTKAKSEPQLFQREGASVPRPKTDSSRDEVSEQYFKF